MKAKRQFSMHSYPLPKDAKGKTFFDKSPSYQPFQGDFFRDSANNRAVDT